MRIILFAGLIALLTFAIQSFLPWWSITLFPLLLGFTVLRHWKEAFFAAFTGVFLLWVIHASVQHYSSTGAMGQIMSDTIGVPLPVLILITGLLGGLVAGLGGLSGFFIQQWKKSLQAQ